VAVVMRLAQAIHLDRGTWTIGYPAPTTR
jgi:hypothetical protein